MSALLTKTPHGGLLKERILLERQDYREKETGETEVLWVPAHSTYACICPILPKGGLELWQAERKVYPTRYQLWLRAQVPLSTTMRVVWRGEILRFLTAPVLNHHRSWQYCILQSTGESVALEPVTVEAEADD